ncbi:MAG: hypothetical protein QXE81_04630 [Desulfurococcaceae archaeon]
MSIPGWLVSVVYKSLFLAGDTGYRRAHLLSKFVFILSVILLISVNPERSYILVLIVAPISIIYPGLEWLIAISSLSAFVGLFLAGSAFILSSIGLFQMTLYQFTMIVIRTIGISIGIIFSFNIISPIELYNILYSLHLRKIAVVPLILWKIIPYGLKSILDSLMVGQLKRELFTKRIAPAVASMLETSWFIEEYCYWRLKSTPKTPISYERSYKYTIILLICALLLAVIQAKAP